MTHRKPTRQEQRHNPVDRAIRSKKKPKKEKLFKIESRAVGECISPAIAFLYQWRSWGVRYATQEQAEKQLAKIMRSSPQFMLDKYEYRIINTRTSNPVNAHSQG